MEPLVVPFGDRLQRLLEELKPPRSQKWLADESGLSAATVSRLIQGKRSPDITSIESLAPVLGIDPELLVSGTDAEARVAENRQWVRRQEYDLALNRLRELEPQLADARREATASLAERDAERARTTVAHQQRLECLQGLQEKTRDLDHAIEDKARLMAQVLEQRGELVRSRRALDEAVLQLHTLAAHMRPMEEELARLGRTTTVTKVLAGFAAAAGAVTVAALMSMSNKEETSEKEE